MTQSLSLSLLPGQAVVSPAAQCATTFVIIQRSLETLLDIDDTAITDFGQGLGSGQ